MQSKVLSNNDASVAMLTDAFQKIIDMMNSRKNALLKEAQQMTQDDLGHLQKQQDDLTTLKHKIEQCRDFTRDTLQNGTNSEIMSARKQMLERTKILCDLHSSSSLSPVTTPSSVPFCSLDTLEEEIKQVGTFVDLRHCSIGEMPKDAWTDETVTSKVIIKDTKGRGICKAKSLIAAKVMTGDINVSQAISIDEKGDGEYSLQFVPQCNEFHVIHVQIKGVHISNSPCHVKVYGPIAICSKPELTIEAKEGKNYYYNAASKVAKERKKCDNEASQVAEVFENLSTAYTQPIPLSLPLSVPYRDDKFDFKRADDIQIKSHVYSKGNVIAANEYAEPTNYRYPTSVYGNEDKPSMASPSTTTALPLFAAAPTLHNSTGAYGKGWLNSRHQRKQ